MGRFLIAHGDAVRDVAFEVDDVDAILAKAGKCGATVIDGPRCYQDSFGSVRAATIHSVMHLCCPFDIRPFSQSSQHWQQRNFAQVSVFTVWLRCSHIDRTTPLQGVLLTGFCPSSNCNDYLRLPFPIIAVS